MGGDRGRAARRGSGDGRSRAVGEGAALSPHDEGSPHEEQLDPRRCGARRRDGGRCTQWKLRGRPRCKLHGGRSLIGAEQPRFKTGRYSKHLPARLAGRYLEALEDPELLSTRAEIALVEARLAELLGRLTTGESGAAWRAAADALTLLEVALAGDGKGVSGALAHLRTIIAAGVGEAATWRELYAVLDQRTRLAESERRRLVEAHQVITVERALLLVSALSEVVRRHVTDRNVRNRIASDLQRLVEGDGGTARGDQG